MKKTTYFAALAAMMTLLATGCDNGMTDAAVAAVAAGQRPGTGSSHVPSMPDGEIDDNGVLTKYTGSETAVVIPDGVTGIGEEAFKGCMSLASVTIPASVTGIKQDAFDECTSLTDVTYKGTLAQWCALSNDGYLMYYAKHVTVEGTDLKQVTTLVIPDRVTGIGSYAFYGCTSLKSVTIPASVTSIGKWAFEGCASLASVTIPASVTSIEWGAFAGCASLASVAIPDGVTSIEYAAFYECESLASVTIPASVTSIEWGAFSNCTKLKEIQFNGTKAQWQAIEGSDTVAVPCIQCSDGYLGVKDVPAYLIMVGTVVTGYADGLPANLVIPDGVTSIGSWAFEGCTSLASVTIPDSVTSIESWAFEGCASLASVTIPDSVTSIGWSAFEDCTSLASVTIPGSVTSIGWSAFSGCDKLTDVIYTGTLAQWCAVNYVSMLMSYAKTVTMSDGTDLKQAETLVIPDGATKIAEYAFYKCESLASVTIPASVTSIGKWAFEDCTSLESVTYGGTKDEWRNIEKEYNIFIRTNVTEITDKDGVTFTVDKSGNITE